MRACECDRSLAYGIAVLCCHKCSACCELAFFERRIKYKKNKNGQDRQMDPQSFFIFFSDAKAERPSSPVPFAPKCPMVVDLMDKKLFLLFDWASIVRTLY